MAWLSEMVQVPREQFKFLRDGSRSKAVQVLRKVQDPRKQFKYFRIDQVPKKTVQVLQRIVQVPKKLT